MIHQNGHVQATGNRCDWWENGCLRIGWPGDENGPATAVHSAPLYVLHDKRQVLKERCGSHILWWQQCCWQRMVELDGERDRNFVEMVVDAHGFWVYPG